MIKDFNPDRDKFTSLNIFQDNLSDISENSLSFEHFHSFFGKYKMNEDENVEDKLFNVNKDTFVNNFNNLIYSDNYFNNCKLFLIKKVKNENNKQSLFNNVKIKEDKIKIIKFIGNKNIKEKIYRKDYYIKHFKAIFGKYLKNKLNDLKNKCFPNLVFNKFSTPNYYYTGNPKIIDNYKFLSWTIKEIIILKQNKDNQNRQFNNKMLIDYIEKNQEKSVNKHSYNELINFINNNLEHAFLDFYKSNNEFKKISKDKDCIFFDKFFKRETGFSLLEKNGFLKVLKNHN